MVTDRHSPPPAVSVIPREEEEDAVSVGFDSDADRTSTTPIFGGVTLVPVLRRSLVLQSDDRPSGGSSITRTSSSSCSLRELQGTYDALVEVGSVDAHTCDPHPYVNLGLVCAVLEQVIDHALHHDRHSSSRETSSGASSSSVPRPLSQNDQAARAVVHGTYERCEMVLRRLLRVEGGEEGPVENGGDDEEDLEDGTAGVVRSDVAGGWRLDRVRVVEVGPGRYAWHWYPGTGTTHIVPSLDGDVVDDNVDGLDLLSGLDRRTLADEEAELLAMAYTAIPSELD